MSMETKGCQLTKVQRRSAKGNCSLAKSHLTIPAAKSQIRVAMPQHMPKVEVERSIWLLESYQRMPADVREIRLATALFKLKHRSEKYFRITSDDASYPMLFP